MKLVWLLQASYKVLRHFQSSVNYTEDYCSTTYQESSSILACLTQSSTGSRFLLINPGKCQIDSQPLVDSFNLDSLLHGLILIISAWSSITFAPPDTATLGSSLLCAPQISTDIKWQNPVIPMMIYFVSLQWLHFYLTLWCLLSPVWLQVKKQ